jgi:hypothetical protein
MGFECSAFRFGPVDYWLGWRPLTAQDRDRYPTGSPCRIRLVRLRISDFHSEDIGSNPICDAILWPAWENITSDRNYYLPPPADLAQSLRSSVAAVQLRPGVPGRRRQRATASHKRGSVGSTPTAGTTGSEPERSRGFFAKECAPKVWSSNDPLPSVAHWSNGKTTICKIVSSRPIRE